MSELAPGGGSRLGGLWSVDGVAPGACAPRSGGGLARTQSGETTGAGIIS